MRRIAIRIMVLRFMLHVLVKHDREYMRDMNNADGIIAAARSCHGCHRCMPKGYERLYK